MEEDSIQKLKNKGWSLGEMDRYKAYLVRLHYGHRQFMCLVHWKIKFNMPSPSKHDLASIAEDAFLRNITQYVDSGGRTRLRSEVEDVTQFHPSPQAEYAEEADPLYTARMMSTKVEQDQKSQDSAPPTVKEPTYSCEADKPVGTRDVEKFLREQQAKLWNGGS